MQSEVFTSKFVINNFVPKILYVKEDDEFHSRFCVYNYFSEIFPELKTDVVVYLWFFDTSGTLLAEREISVKHKGQLQFDVSELKLKFEGTVGISMIPKKIPEKSQYTSHAKNCPFFQSF